MQRILSIWNGMLAVAANGSGIAEVGVKQRERFGSQVAGTTTAVKVLEPQFPAIPLIAEVSRAIHKKQNMKKPKTLLPDPIAKIRNVSEGHPERNSVERVKKKSFWCSAEEYEQGGRCKKQCTYCRNAEAE